MKERWYTIGGFAVFIVLIILANYVGDLKMKSELTIEEKIASEYCNNLSIRDEDSWNECYNDVINNASLRFDELQNCKKESKNEWNADNWKNCYESKRWGL